MAKSNSTKTNPTRLEARITNREFKREQWIESIKKTLYYYKLELDDGNKVEVGVRDLNSPRINVGETITYTVKEGSNLINIVKSTGQQTEEMSAVKPTGKGSKSKPGSTQSRLSIERQKPVYKSKSANPYYGYAYSYAKDMVIAGKVSEKDCLDLDRIAKKILFEIEGLLQRPDSFPIDVPEWPKEVAPKSTKKA